MSSMCTLDLSYAWLSRLSAYVHIVYVLCMRVHAIRTTLFFSSFFSFGNPRYSRCHDNIYIYILVQAIHSLIWRTTKLNLLEIAFGHFVFFGDAALFVVVAVYYVLYFWWLGFGVQINMRSTHRTVFFFLLLFIWKFAIFFFWFGVSQRYISSIQFPMDGCFVGEILYITMYANFSGVCITITISIGAHVLIYTIIMA